MAPAQQRAIHLASLTVRSDQPLIGIVLIEDGHEITRCFTDEAEADAGVATTTDARDLADAWSDLDWEEIVAELERNRHQNVPTPPIDDL